METDIFIYVGGEIFMQAPGFKSQANAYIDPKASTFFNITMSDYECHRTDGASLIITYHPFFHVTCQAKKTVSYFEYMITIALVS